MSYVEAKRIKKVEGVPPPVADSSFGEDNANELEPLRTNLTSREKLHVTDGRKQGL